MTSEETNGADRSEMGLAQQTISMLVYPLALLIPFQFVLMLQYRPTAPTETIMAGFTVGLMGTVYWSKTRTASVPQEKTLLKALTHPIVRGAYLVLGAVGVLFALVAGATHPAAFLVVLLIFGFLVALVYWYLFRPSARSG